MKTILAWLRQPEGSEDRYFHSEGVCCRTDQEHENCVVDPDYTLRKALQYSRDLEYLIDWCPECFGYDANCIFCHSAKQLLTDTISQRQEAYNALGNNHHIYSDLLNPVKKEIR